MAVQPRKIRKLWKLAYVVTPMPRFSAEESSGTCYSLYIIPWGIQFSIIKRSKKSSWWSNLNG